MFWLHCNKCYRVREIDASMQLCISKCGHVLCKPCIQPICVICSRPYQAILIGRDMPTGMATLFEDPMKLLRTIQRVMRFQQQQQESLLTYQVFTVPKLLEKTQRQCEGYANLQTRLDAEVVREEKRIKKLHKYLEYHEKRLHNKRNNNNNDESENNVNGNSQASESSPSTPTLSNSSNSERDEDDDVAVDEGIANLSASRSSSNNSRNN